MPTTTEITDWVKRSGTTIIDVYEEKVERCTAVELNGADADQVRRYLREPGAWSGASPASKSDMHEVSARQLRKETLEMLADRMARRGKHA